MDLETVSERIATGRIGHAVSRLVPATPIWGASGTSAACSTAAASISCENCLRPATTRYRARTGWTRCGRSAPSPQNGWTEPSRRGTARRWPEPLTSPATPFRRSPANTFSSRLATSCRSRPTISASFTRPGATTGGSTTTFRRSRPPLTDAAIAIWRNREELGIDPCSSTTCSPTRPSGRSRVVLRLGRHRALGQFTDGESSAADEDFDPDDLSPAEREPPRGARRSRGRERRRDGFDERSLDAPARRRLFVRCGLDGLPGQPRVGPRRRCSTARELRRADRDDQRPRQRTRRVRRLVAPARTPVPALRRVPWVVREGQDQETCDPHFPREFARARRAARTMRTAGIARRSNRASRRWATDNGPENA